MDTPRPTSGFLVLRVWHDATRADGVGARLLSVGGDDELTLAVAAGIDDICDAVRRWLVDYVAAEGPDQASADDAVTRR